MGCQLVYFFLSIPANLLTPSISVGYFPSSVSLLLNNTQESLSLGSSATTTTTTATTITTKTKTTTTKTTNAAATGTSTVFTGVLAKVYLYLGLLDAW